MVFAGPYRESYRDLNPGKPNPVAKILEALRMNPLSADEEVHVVASQVEIDLLPQNIRQSLAVRSLTMWGLYKQLFDVDGKKRREICSEANLTWREQGAFRQRNKSWLNQTVDEHQPPGENRHLVEVDLNLPQDVLVSQFREWISEKQNRTKARGPRIIPNVPHLKRWTEMGLLPCMDLMIWAAEEEIDMSARDIARAIHPDGLAHESATAKTTIPLARDFFSYGAKSSLLLRRLKNELATERAGILRATNLRSLVAKIGSKLCETSSEPRFRFYGIFVTCPTRSLDSLQ